MWQILEENAPEKYSLSARACLGILTRAERRGKPLPAMLWEALVEVVELEEASRSSSDAGSRGGGKGILTADVPGALTTGNNYNVAMFMAGQGAKAQGIAYSEAASPTLKSTLSGGNTVPTVAFYCRRGFGDYAEDEKTSTLRAAHDGNQSDCVVKHDRRYIVRRLTPLECCRLQGFSDYWTEDVPGSDSAKYKMWGNGMSLPCLLYLLQGIEEGNA